MQMPVAVESVGVSEGFSQIQRAVTEGIDLQGHRLSSPDREAEEVLNWVLKITQRGMVKKRSYGSI